MHIFQDIEKEARKEVDEVIAKAKVKLLFILLLLILVSHIFPSFAVLCDLQSLTYVLF